MRNILLTLLIMLALTMALAACGGNSGGATSSDGGGNASAGEELFNEKLIGTQPGCVTCHTLEEGATLVGPSLAGIGNTAATREADKSAEEYLVESITMPDAYVVDGFTEGTMPAQLVDELDEQQVNDLVAYLMTLK